MNNFGSLMTVKVRFAPSPTGYLHIGNARAALINWLFAKKHNGHFMFRLDDTDLERSKREYEQRIYEDLKWLGLDYQSFAKQSERFDRYHQAKEALIKAGRLYPCYETPEELEFKRKRQLAKGAPPVYDRAALNLTDAEKQAFEAKGIKPHWRFLLKSEHVKWDDMVRGPVDFSEGHLSDPVLVKADGTYLYTITSVVDDIDFDITHIIRGEDHVTNTAVQIQIFDALGEISTLDNIGDDIPDPKGYGGFKKTNIVFGHTTLLMGADGDALSKRLGSKSLGDFRSDGLEPMAINCVLARLGTSMPVEPCLDLETLAQGFDIGTFSRTPPKLDPKDLWLMNHKILTTMPYGKIKNKLQNIKSEAPEAIHLNKINEDIWNIIRGNLHDFKEVIGWCKIIFGDLETGADVEDKDFIRAALGCLPTGPWDETTWGLWTNSLKEKTGKKGKDLFMPLRKTLTGMDHGPEMKDLLPIIGEEKVKQRLTVS